MDGPTVLVTTVVSGWVVTTPDKVVPTSVVATVATVEVDVVLAVVLALVTGVSVSSNT